MVKCILDSGAFSDSDDSQTPDDSSNDDACPGQGRHSLYERIGGYTAIQAVLSLIHDKCVKDETIGHWFEDSERMFGMRSQLPAFVAFAFGSGNRYKGRDLGQAHAKLVQRGLGDKDFDVMVELLKEALRELHVTEDLVDEAGRCLDKVRSLVLGRTGQTSDDSAAI